MSDLQWVEGFRRIGRRDLRNVLSWRRNVGVATHGTINESSRFDHVAAPSTNA